MRSNRVSTLGLPNSSVSDGENSMKIKEYCGTILTFAAVQVGGRFLQEANTRNARAMQTAKELFDMIGVSK